MEPWGPGGEGDWAWATHSFQAASVPVLLTPCSDPLELILGPGRGVGGEGKKAARLLLPAGLLATATAVQGEPRHCPPHWPSLLAPEWQSSRRVKMAMGVDKQSGKQHPVVPPWVWGCGRNAGLGLHMGAAAGIHCSRRASQRALFWELKERVSSTNPSHCMFGQASSLNAHQEATLTGSS